MRSADDAEFAKLVCSDTDIHSVGSGILHWLLQAGWRGTRPEISVQIAPTIVLLSFRLTPPRRSA